MVVYKLFVCCYSTRAKPSQAHNLVTSRCLLVNRSAIANHGYRPEGVLFRTVNHLQTGVQTSTMATIGFTKDQNKTEVYCGAVRFSDFMNHPMPQGKDTSTHHTTAQLLFHCQFDGVNELTVYVPLMVIPISRHHSFSVIAYRRQLWNQVIVKRP